MKQVVQNFRSGELELLEVPCPQVQPGHLLVQTRASLVSAGTERMLVQFGRASLLGKARQSPERVRQVWDKIRTDGLVATVQAVQARLDEPLPLGYCNAGVVTEVGQGVSHFAVGDRVVSNGTHSEMVHVPIHLAARIPEGVSDEQAAFTVLGAIGLQGIRLLAPQLDERVAVYGLGLVGLLTVQMLVASGVRVLGVDLNPQRLALAEQFGATPVDLAAGADPVAAAMSFSSGHGLDGVLVTASAKDDSIISHAARMSRKRGRIVLVGVVDTHLIRAEFYEKELTFQVSCSYGPGRYDPAYEQRGIDYPLPFVRWTEQRNLEAVLSMLASSRLRVAPLITSRLAHDQAQQAYDALAVDASQLGIVFQYPGTEPPTSRVVPTRRGNLAPRPHLEAAGEVRAGFIGAGAFAKRYLFPELRRLDMELLCVASQTGTSAADAARKFGIAASTTDHRAILEDPQINTVFITTHSDSHARLISEALRAGKHVFCEKPAAVDEAGLAQLRAACAEASDRQLMIGFNRRFAPHVVKIKELLAGRRQPICATMLVNAGQLDKSHWMKDYTSMGNRIIGEGCHWIDLLSFMADAPIESVSATTIGRNQGDAEPMDHVSVSLQFADGSLGTVHYFANGHRSFPKERLTLFCGGRTLELDNFRVLKGLGWPGFRRLKLWTQDKGHGAQFLQFVRRLNTGGPPLIPHEQLWNATEASFAAERSVTAKRQITLQRETGSPPMPG